MTTFKTQLDKARKTADAYFTSAADAVTRTNNALYDALCVSYEMFLSADNDPHKYQSFLDKLGDGYDVTFDASRNDNSPSNSVIKVVFFPTKEQQQDVGPRNQISKWATVLRNAKRNNITHGKFIAFVKADGIEAICEAEREAVVGKNGQQQGKPGKGSSARDNYVHAMDHINDNCTKIDSVPLGSFALEQTYEEPYVFAIGKAGTNNDFEIRDIITDPVLNRRFAELYGKHHKPTEAPTTSSLIKSNPLYPFYAAIRLGLKLIPKKIKKETPNIIITTGNGGDHILIGYNSVAPYVSIRSAKLPGLTKDTRYYLDGDVTTILEAFENDPTSDWVIIPNSQDGLSFDIYNGDWAGVLSTNPASPADDVSVTDGKSGKLISVDGTAFNSITDMPQLTKTNGKGQTSRFKDEYGKFGNTSKGLSYATGEVINKKQSEFVLLSEKQHATITKDMIGTVRHNDVMRIVDCANKGLLEVSSYNVIPADGLGENPYLNHIIFGTFDEGALVVTIPCCNVDVTRASDYLLHGYALMSTL